jgi:hypothetical protein
MLVLYEVPPHRIAIHDNSVYDPIGNPQHRTVSSKAQAAICPLAGKEAANPSGPSCGGAEDRRSWIKCVHDSNSVLAKIRAKQP